MSSLLIAAVVWGSASTISEADATLRSVSRQNISSVKSKRYSLVVLSRTETFVSETVRHVYTSVKRVEGFASTLDLASTIGFPRCAREDSGKFCGDPKELQIPRGLRPLVMTTKVKIATQSMKIGGSDRDSLAALVMTAGSFVVIRRKCRSLADCVRS